MYVPASELQQYKGNWTCPVCLMNMRDEDRQAEEKREGLPLRRLTYPETCERCGRDTPTLYIWNARKLCKSCLNEEKETWGVIGGGPSGAAQAISMTPLRVAKKESFIEHVISEFLGIFGIKKKQPEIVEVHHPKMPVERAKPMTEGKIEKQTIPQSEGLMKKTKKRKKKTKKRKPVSFPEAVPKKKSEKKKEKDNPFKDFKDKKKK